MDKSKEQIIWGGNYFGLPPTRGFIVWDKKNDGRDFADCEYAWTSFNKVARIFRKRPIKMDGGKVHPTQKPIYLFLWAINEFAFNVKTVCDPYIGSGTTAIACEKLGREWIGIEISEKYYEIASKRIEMDTCTVCGEKFDLENEGVDIDDEVFCSYCECEYTFRCPVCEDSEMIERQFIIGAVISIYADTVTKNGVYEITRHPLFGIMGEILPSSVRRLGDTVKADIWLDINGQPVIHFCRYCEPEIKRKSILFQKFKNAVKK